MVGYFIFPPHLTSASAQPDGETDSRKLRLFNSIKRWMLFCQ